MAKRPTVRARRSFAPADLLGFEPVAGLATAFLLALLVACSPPQSTTSLQGVDWQHFGDGWARTVPLDPPLTLDVTGVGDVLDAVVFPGEPGHLVVESKSLTQRISIEDARRVRVPLVDRGPVQVRFEGAAASLHGVRILRGGRTAGTRPAPRRVLLVVIDTLRDDAVNPTTTPELLDAFAGGARFTRAYATASWTLPSMASVLTGKPRAELALANGTIIALAQDESSIASDFAARGFTTVGVTANYTINHENGFSAGFDLFVAEKVLGPGYWPDSEWVLERANRVLEWFPDRDLFLYLHFMEPHDPFVDHESGEVLPGPFSGEKVAPAAADRIRAAYRSEVRHVTAQVADFLREAGPFERVVVTADHGEELADHGGWKHGPTLYPEVVQVPLLIRGTGVEPGDVDRPVSMLDLRRWLGSEDVPLSSAFSSEVDISTFAHTAPRFAAVVDDGQTVLFGRNLVPPSSDVVDPIARWLRRTHPQRLFVGPSGESREPTLEEAEAAGLRLIRHLHTMGPGQWIWVPASVPRLRVEVEGALGGGWWWGGARRVELQDSQGPRVVANPSQSAGVATLPADAKPAPLTLEIEAPEPFVLLFVPAAKGGRITALDGGAVDALPDPPERAPRERAAAWRDRGRPPAALQGVEETMERLRTQGYI